MAIVRVMERERYLVVSKTPIEDERLSFKAVGLLVYLLSKPDNWTARVEHLKTTHADGRHSVRTGLRELEGAGYIERYQPKNKDGTFGELEMRIYEMPQLNPDHPDQQGEKTADKKPVHGENAAIKGNSPQAENPSTDDLSTENRTLMTNDVVINDIKNNNNRPPGGDNKNPTRGNSVVVAFLKEKFKNVVGREHKLTPEYLDRIAEHDREDIDRALTLLELALDSGTVDNPEGYFRRALEEGWELPESATKENEPPPPARTTFRPEEQDVKQKPLSYVADKFREIYRENGLLPEGAG